MFQYALTVVFGAAIAVALAHGVASGVSASFNGMAATLNAASAGR